MSELAPLDRTRLNQRAASDPRSSAWVIANAGSGKTHVLTQRVIRLLLAGADPAAILCLTFTKIAAAEMARRVFGTLGEWTTLPDSDLAKSIEALQGEPPSEREMRDARRLFARALETPGGLKIQTIHAFCERLLHEFPFEANVPGQFTVMDDAAAAAAIATTRSDVLERAAAEPDSMLGRAVRHMAERANDEQISQALDALIQKRDLLRRWMDAAELEEGHGTVEDALADLRRRLSLSEQETEASICGEICSSKGWGQPDCRTLCEAMRGSQNRTDAGAATALETIFNASTAVTEANARIAFFLNQESETKVWKIRDPSRRFSAESRRRHTRDLAKDFSAEAERVLVLTNRLAIARTFEATAALLIVGDAILQAYHAAKRRAGALDFADLIAKARNLLSRSDAAQWVLFKLDRRVDHILVDEAQDTSPDQWRVVQAIAEDFFAGVGASREARTIFAVGDDKQSIFGFQGADPRNLVRMQDFFGRKVREAEETFVALPLFLSFRSTQEVLQAVDQVFSGDLAGRITGSNYEAHSTHRPHEPGAVVLLPRTSRVSRDPPEEWTQSYEAPSAAETVLAKNIAEEIWRIIGTSLPSGKRVKAGEILILVRRRDAFAAAMNRALIERNIPAAGADRIPISTHIAVLDLLALADVMLLPEDDLQLAALLKSPLFGISEEELMQLAIGRGARAGSPASPTVLVNAPKARRQGDLFDPPTPSTSAQPEPAVPQRLFRKTLWAALHAAEEDRLKASAERLDRWRRMADRQTPFQFFATILGVEGGRRAFRARLGAEADDVLDMLLSQALAYENVEAPSLQGFVCFIRANERDIKRETEEGASGVRVMTVHGAKGLEADVVFLVDTGGKAVVPGQRDLLVAIGRDRDDPAFLWRRRKEEAIEAQQRADAVADGEKEQEYLRLLYVAMTRARDVLYVAGVRLLQQPPFCWYTLVRDALLPKDGSVETDEAGELKAPYRWPHPARSALEPEDAAECKAAASQDAFPAWLAERAPTPSSAPEPLRPSIGLADPDPEIARPRRARPAADGAALIRGRLVHRLLDALPRVPPELRDVAAERLLGGELGTGPELVREIRAEAEAVLAHAELHTAFAGEARAEVAIVGNVPTERGVFSVSGRIDRLIRDGAGWRLVDFKTDRSVPASAADADPGYILQLALYRKLMMDMEPGIPVAAALVYTAGPNVMPIPTEMMEQALARIGVRANAFP